MPSDAENDLAGARYEVYFVCAHKLHAVNSLIQ